MMLPGESTSIETSNDELRTVRDGMRTLNHMVDALEAREADKFVLCTHSRMRAVLLSIEEYARLTGQRRGEERAQVRP